MNKEVISVKQGIFIIILFLSGSTSIFVTGLDAKKDTWLATVIGIIIALPMIIMFARLHYIFPNKDLFDIIKICFGKFIGTGLIIIFTTYFFYWTADVLNNYGFFIWTNNLHATPKTILIIIFIALSIWVLNAGIEVLGRTSQLLAIFAIISLFISITLLIPKMNLNNVRPVLSEGFKPVFKGAYSVFTQPFVQTIAFTVAFTNLKNKKSSFKIYLIGVLGGGIIALIVSFTNILVIGANTATNMYYPSYVAVSRINIFDFIQRLEVIIALVFILGGFIKISILLLCTCKGVAKIFNCNNYRFIIIPISLMIINLTYFQYDSVKHYFSFNSDIWATYFLPFQVILPIIIWIVAEIKKKKYKDNYNDLKT